MSAVENVSLVRERSDPAVYLIVGDTKFRIEDTAEFAALGMRWERVRIVSDGSLQGFRESRLHAPPGVRPSDVFFDCRESYDAIDGKYYSNCCSSKHLVRKDILIAGWLSAAPYFNRAPHGLEDVFYDLALDAAFLDRMYGTTGLSNALAGARWPGNPLAPLALTMATTPAPAGGQAGTPYSSWFVPGLSAGGTQIHPELQAWHPQDQPPFGSFTSHWQGRGPAPAAWRPLPDDSNSWFPFNPRDPEGTGISLAVGDYVVMRGSLWQDHGHGPSSWDNGPTKGHSGWSEIHPPDWIVRVRNPGPNARLTGRSIGLSTNEVTGGEFLEEAEIVPDFQPSSPSHYLRVRTVKREIQPAATYSSTLTTSQISRHPDKVVTRFGVTPTGGLQGRVKGAVIVGWAEQHVRDQVWVDDSLPAGATVGSSGGDSWEWTLAGPGPFTSYLAHRSAPAPGLHQHFFWGSSQPLTLLPVDRMFCMVHMDPSLPPEELMLQFFDGTWEHRAFWGEDLIGWGVPGTASRFRAGDLPASGEWVRLEVDAAALGLSANPISGVAFTCYGGAALWDYTGIKRAPTRDASFVSQTVPDSLVTGQIQDVTVTMRNTGSETWTPTGQYRLGSQSLQDNQIWGPARAGLSGPVLPGEEATFAFRITAPSSTGFFRFRWRMLQEAVEWFGDYTADIRVRVFSGTGPVMVPDVTGMRRAEAGRAIREADLVPAFSGPAGNLTEVGGQSPPAFNMVERGSTVRLRMVNMV